MELPSAMYMLYIYCMDLDWFCALRLAVFRVCRFPPGQIISQEQYSIWKKAKFRGIFMTTERPGISNGPVNG